jgi:hypothetical protein
MVGHLQGNPDWRKVGIFAQRKKGRANKIGIFICELLETNGLSLKVRALDAIDGRPVLDIAACQRIHTGVDPCPTTVLDHRAHEGLLHSEFSGIRFLKLMVNHTSPR